MAINDPQAIKFVDEVVRPLCERIRALKADIDSARVAYDAGIGELFAGFGKEPIEDGREAEGVSRLKGDDVLAFVDLVLYQMRDNVLGKVGGSEVIARPCVRSLIT